MKATKWAGLVSNASPYILPPGAAVVQENLHTRTPGQLTTRRGMRLVIHDEFTPGGQSAGKNVSVLACLQGGATKIISLASDGQVRVSTAPRPGTATSTPSYPALTVTAGSMKSSYVGQFVGDTVEDLS